VSKVSEIDFIGRRAGLDLRPPRPQIPGFGGSASTASRPSALRKMPLSIIVPVLDEEAGIVATLQAVRGADAAAARGHRRRRAPSQTARSRSPSVVTTVDRRGRGAAAQMNAGASAARGELCCSCHDIRGLPRTRTEVTDGLTQRPGVGPVDVRIDGRQSAAFRHRSHDEPALPLPACQRATRRFVTTAAFADDGGYPDIALMEDIARSRASSVSPAMCDRGAGIDSGRRWAADW